VLGAAAAAAHTGAVFAHVRSAGQDDRGGISPPTIAPGDDERREVALPAMRRTVAIFDFEERARQPYDFPVAWYRIGPVSPEGQDGRHGDGRPGHPLFGRMEFSDDNPRSGEWSFMFELEGGSMAAALAPDTVPIIPGGNYLVTTWVRTQGLHHARARIAATLFDQYGRALPGSRIESELTETAGEWQRVALTVGGEFEEAADLVLELLLLQPAQYRAGARDPHEPMLEDVRGRVWFDDVEVFHLPQISLSVCDGPQVIVAPERPRMRLTLRDLASDQIEARVTVEDSGGAAVTRQTTTAQRGRSAQFIDLHDLAFGVYRASVDLLHNGRRIGGTTTQFAYLPSPPREPHARLPRFGVSLEDLPVTLVPQSAEIMTATGLRSAIIPAWDRSGPAQEGEAQNDHLRPELAHLLDREIDVIFAFPSVPYVLARDLRLDPDQTLDMFAADEALIRPYLEDLLIAFGQRVGAWQVGGSASAESFRRDDLDAAVAKCWRTLARLVPGPRVLVPWSPMLPLAAASATAASDDGLRDASRRGWNVFVPYHVQPQWIGRSLEEALSSGEDVIVTIEPLPRDGFSGRERAADIAMRALYAHRVGAKDIYLSNPWFVRENGGAAEPDDTLAAWVQTSRSLSGRTFAGDVPLSRGLECWLFEDENGSGVLVAWNRTAGAEASFIESHLAAGAVEVVDLAGNRAQVEPTGGIHRIPIRGAPVFIEGVDPALVRFQQGFAVEPPFAVSVPREHVHEIVITNPWDMVIAGTMRLIEPEEWTFSPSRMNFTLPPRGEVRLPFTLTFGRTAEAGPARIGALFEMTAHDALRFQMAADFEVGLAYLEIEPTWRLVPAPDGSGVDLSVGVYITNTGIRPLSLEAHVLAPGYSRMRRPVSLLEPGETILKSFHLADGGGRLSGRTIRIGVGEIDNPERLNRSILIPDLGLRARAAEN